MQQKRVCVNVHRLNYEAIYQIRKYKIIYIYICGVRYVCHSSEDTSANLSQNAIWSVTSCKHHLGKPVTLSLISGQRISGGGCRQVVVGLGQTAHHHISIIYIYLITMTRGCQVCRQHTTTDTQRTRALCADK